jgi:hypothetical protein
MEATREVRTLMRAILGCVLPIGLALSSVSCGGITNQLSGTQHLTFVSVVPGGSWSGYSQTTFQDTIPTDKTVHLLNVTFTSSTGEFSWLASTVGTAPSGQQVVSLSSMEGITGPATLNIVDTGDLRPLFVDDHTVRLNWNAQFPSAVERSYPDGVTVTVSYTLEMD